MRVAEALKFISGRFKEPKTIDDPFFESELLLMHFCEMERAQLHASPETEITPEKFTEICLAVERRIQGLPMAYILGYRDFYKSRFKVGRGVLIPRPETELIVESALQKGPFSYIADLGCGSGCISLSLLSEFKDARLWACDISEEALFYFEENAKALNLMDRIESCVGDVLENKAENRYDLVVSNPPYIARNDKRLADDVKKHEPGLALYAADNGLQFYKAWSPWAHTALKSGGWAMFEFGEGQGKDIFEIVEKSGFKNIELKKDLSGKERIVCAQKD